MSDLTPRQTQILRLIQRFINETGMPPTRAEIAHELGFRSANAAEEHLRVLARKGVSGRSTKRVRTVATYRAGLDAGSNSAEAGVTSSSAAQRSPARFHEPDSFRLQ